MWEFPYDVNNDHVQMVFTSVAGHLMELDFADLGTQWSACDPIRCFDAPVRKSVPEV